MIWASVALAGRLTLIGPGRVERPHDLLDVDTPFEQVDEKTVVGDGWFRLRGLGVPCFVFLESDTQATVDLRSRQVTGSEPVRWQLQGQWEADVLGPADLTQAKKAVKKLEKTMRAAPARARELALGRLAMVLAAKQVPEIAAYEDWSTRAHEILGWSEATAETPTFVDFALEVGRALRRDLELVAAEERLQAAAVPGANTLRYGLLAASIGCCVVGAETDAAVRERSTAWPALTARLDARLPRPGNAPPPIRGTSFDDSTGTVALAKQGRVTVVFWEVAAGLSDAVVDVIRSAAPPDQGVVVVGLGDDEADWRAKVREHVTDGVIHVLSSEAHDRWHVAPGAVRVFAVQDGVLAAEHGAPVGAP